MMPTASSHDDPRAAPQRPAAPDHFYVVWNVPSEPELFGIFRAKEGEGWQRLERLLPGRQYAGSGAAWRRANTEEQALYLYSKEHERHGLPEEPPRYDL